MKPNSIILAGGKSSRMGQDKGLMPLFGSPMISHVLNLLQPMSNELIIVANNDDYLQFGHTLIKDEYEAKGPLAGIYSGLKHSDQHVNLIVSCDMPFISADLVEYLLGRSGTYDVTTPLHLGSTEQLVAIYTRNCLPVFKACIESGRLKIKEAVKQMVHQEVEINAELPFYKSNLFMNVNSPEDFDKITSSS